MSGFLVFSAVVTAWAGVVLAFRRPLHRNMRSIDRARFLRVRDPVLDVGDALRSKVGPLAVLAEAVFGFVLMVALTVFGLQSFLASLWDRTSGLPQLWEVLGHLFPEELRQQVYDPARSELEARFRRARQYRKGWKRSLVTIIYLCLTLWLVVGTARVGAARRLVPRRLRDWWAA